ncbi:helix-turn-helix domain-containing protein [Streptomyces sp. NPDC046631]|uniref:helix-turn-helix domain-containing protein n=2 Tax=unclassified Streptomyces TaxID=2593676 RepID=UPI0033DE897D
MPAMNAIYHRLPGRQKPWHPQVINAPPADDHVIVEAQVRDFGFSAAQQNEVWKRWCEGQSFSLIGRALGPPMHHVRQFLYQSGGIRLTPQRRSERHLTGSEREEISRGIAAGDSARQLAKRLGRSPSTVSREIARNGGRNLYRAASADATAYTRALAQAVRARPTARSARPGGSARGTGSVTGRGRSSERVHDRHQRRPKGLLRSGPLATRRCPGVIPADAGSRASPSSSTGAAYVQHGRSR